MKVWLERSEKEKNTAFLGAEHEGIAGFARLHLGARELLHAVSCLTAAAMLRKLSARRGNVGRAERAARARMTQAARHQGRLHRKRG